MLKYASNEITLPAKHYLEHILAKWSYAGRSRTELWRTMMSEKKNSSAPMTKMKQRQVSQGVAIGLGSAALGTTEAWAGNEEEVARTGETIHQEPVFKASRKRVYEALTDANQFNNVVQLSAAMKSGIPPGAAPTEISREAGGTFSVFGGHIVVRHIELVPNERIVQAWRVVTWDAVVYSIDKVELVEERRGTKLVFEHTVFPKVQGQ